MMLKKQHLIFFLKKKYFITCWNIVSSKINKNEFSKILKKLLFFRYILST